MKLLNTRTIDFFKLIYVLTNSIKILGEIKGCTKKGDQIIKDDEMGDPCSMHGRDDVYKILIGKPKRKRPLGRWRLRW
jgi:hypothetical protein